MFKNILRTAELNKIEENDAPRNAKTGKLDNSFDSPLAAQMMQQFYNMEQANKLLF